MSIRKLRYDFLIESHFCHQAALLSLGCVGLIGNQGCCDGQPCCDGQSIDPALQDCCEFDGASIPFNMREQLCCSGVQSKDTHGCCPAGGPFGTPFLKADYWCCNDDVRRRRPGRTPSGDDVTPNPGCQ